MKARIILRWILLGAVLALPMLGLISAFLPGIWFSLFGWSGNIFALLWLAILHLIPTQALLLAIERKRSPGIMVAGLCVGGLSLAICWWFILRGAGAEPGWLEGTPAIFYAWTGGFAIFRVSQSKTPLSRVAVFAGVSALSLTAISAMGLIFFNEFTMLPMWDEAWKATMGLAVITVAALAVSVIHASMRADVEELGDQREYSATCPRCGRPQSLRTGPNRCEQCRLLITLKVHS